MPKLDGILETTIHTEDMVRARAFYEGVLGWSRSTATVGCPLLRWPDAMSSWSFARALPSKPLSCPAGPLPATVVMACCMWHSPLVRTTRSLGGTSHFPRRHNRSAQRLGTWWTQHLFPRSGRSPFGTRNARIVVNILGARHRDPLNPIMLRMSAIGTKRTSACALHMSAYNPKRTSRLLRDRRSVVYHFSLSGPVPTC